MSRFVPANPALRQRQFHIATRAALLAESFERLKSAHGGNAEAASFAALSQKSNAQLDGVIAEYDRVIEQARIDKARLLERQAPTSTQKDGVRGGRALRIGALSATATALWFALDTLELHDDIAALERVALKKQERIEQRAAQQQQQQLAASPTTAETVRETSTDVDARSSPLAPPPAAVAVPISQQRELLIAVVVIAVTSAVAGVLVGITLPSRA
jgi:hypothetical protein